jgi:SAM-dependent methyltransferase
MDRKEWDERYAAGRQWSVEPNRFLVEEVTGHGPMPPGRVLDLACGEGRNAIWLAEQGGKVTAVDFSDVALDRGRAVARERGVDVDFRNEDVRAWHPPAAAYDLVIVLYLQLPAGEREPVWERACRAVAPGGTFLLVGHDLRNLADGHGGPRTPDVLYTAADVVPVAEAAGLRVERAGEVLRPVVRDDGTPAEAIDCLVRARRPA